MKPSKQLTGALALTLCFLVFTDWVTSQDSVDDVSAKDLLDQAQAGTDDPALALKFATEARAGAKKEGNPPLEVKALLTIALSHRKLKRYGPADDACDQAFTISRLIRNSDLAFEACDLASKMHYVRGRYDLAQVWEERALAFAKDTGDLANEAQTYNDLGVLLKRQGQIAPAMENYERSLEARRKLGDRRGEAQSLMNLGIIFKNLGDYPRALEYQNEALAIREDLQDPNALGQSYQNLGNLCGHLGDYDKAADYYRRSLAIHQETGNLGGTADALSNLSEAYSNLGRRDEALTAIEEALESARMADDVPAVASCLRRIGELQTESGQLDLALENLKQAVSLSRRTQTKRTEASALLMLGKALYDAGEIDAAVEALSNAAAVSDDINDLPTFRNATSVLAPILKELGRHDEAYEALSRSRAADATMEQTETRAIVQNLEARHTLQAKNSQIDLLERDNQIQALRIARQRWFGGFIVALLTLGLAVAAAGWARARDLRKSHRLLEEKNSEITAQQKTLEAVNNALENAARQLNSTNKALVISSITDGLTKVFNRKHILECLDKELRRARRHGHDLAILMIDLDHFKNVNDCYGHRAGDSVLEQTAAAMQRELRVEDVIGRYGGEEFLVVLPATNLTGAVEVAERIRCSVQDMVFDEERGAVKQTLSIGAADLKSCDQQTAEALLRSADSALYGAKDLGRNRTLPAVELHCPHPDRNGAQVQFKPR